MKYSCTAISDTHCAHDDVKLKGGDFLFHAGDITYFGQPDEVYPFMVWFSKQNYKHKVFIAGNHDFGFEPIGQGKECDTYGNFTFRGRNFQKGLQNEYRAMAKRLGIHYLDKESITLDGINIYGIPDQPEFCGWAFNFYTQEEARTIYSPIPDDTDVLITHSPPYGILDQPQQFGDNRLGDQTLRDMVDIIKPKVHIFGHIHEGYGKKKIKGTTFINAAFCSIPYSVHNKPINFTLEK